MDNYSITDSSEAGVPEIVFLSYLEGNYSRSSVYADQLALNSIFRITRIELARSQKSKFFGLKRIVKNYSGRNVVYVVMSPSHYFVPLLRFWTRSPIILDAGWPLSDATVRPNLLGKLKQARNLLVDLLAFHSASTVLLESEVQLKRCIKRFKLKKDKLSAIYTGFNEGLFDDLEGVCPPELKDWNGIGNFVLFRGKYNIESGLERINRIFTKGFNGSAVICTDKISFDYIKSPHLKIISRTLSLAEMKFVYEKSKFTISQLSNHGRLRYTIPHKIFESIYFNSPVASFGTEAIREIFESDKSFIEIPKDASDAEIVDLLNSVIQDLERLEICRTDMKLIVRKKIAQVKLACDFQEQVLRFAQSSRTQS